MIDECPKCHRVGEPQHDVDGVNLYACGRLLEGCKQDELWKVPIGFRALNLSVDMAVLGGDNDRVWEALLNMLHDHLDLYLDAVGVELLCEPREKLTVRSLKPTPLLEAAKAALSALETPGDLDQDARDVVIAKLVAAIEAEDPDAFG